MKTNLYIPKKLSIGFRKREDTFTGKLAYVIYTDDKGKLRKQASWDGWRDKKIDVVELENKPNNGFCLNKGIQRFSDWGSARSVVRVWDPRDFEFEISMDNLIGILMHSDVSKRDIQQDCVFAWAGTELVLLPTNTQEYQDSVKFTAQQGTKFSAKQLVVGHTYQTRKEGEVIYLGNLTKWDFGRGKDDASGRSRIWKFSQTPKRHTFISTEKGGSYRHQSERKDPLTYISHKVGNDINDDYAGLRDIHYKKWDTLKTIGYELTVPDRDTVSLKHYRNNIRPMTFHVQHEGKDYFYTAFRNVELATFGRVEYVANILKTSGINQSDVTVLSMTEDGTPTIEYGDNGIDNYYSYRNRQPTKLFVPAEITALRAELDKFVRALQLQVKFEIGTATHASFGDHALNVKMVNAAIDETSLRQRFVGVNFIREDGARNPVNFSHTYSPIEDSI